MQHLSTLNTTLDNGIFIIEINRPEKLNALNKQVIEELGMAIGEVYDNKSIRSALITGNGTKAFVAGADISEFISMDGKAGAALAATGQEGVFNKIEHSPKPVIAAVNGFALGGGCELALACHFRICSENARFGQPEVNLGLVPGYGGTQRLTKLVGKGRAMELMMTGNMIDAGEVKAIGLVNHVTSPETLLPKAIEILTTINSKAPIAVSHIISLCNLAAAGAANGLDEEIKAFGELFDTADAKEGAAAFLEKRRPVFKGL